MPDNKDLNDYHVAQRAMQKQVILTSQTRTWTIRQNRANNIILSIRYSKIQEIKCMRINGFVSIAMAVPQNRKFAEPNLETKRAGIHRMQRNKKEVRAGRSGHFGEMP